MLIGDGLYERGGVVIVSRSYRLSPLEGTLLDCVNFTLNAKALHQSCNFLDVSFYSHEAAFFELTLGYHNLSAIFSALFALESWMFSFLLRGLWNKGVWVDMVRGSLTLSFSQEGIFSS